MTAHVVGEENVVVHTTGQSDKKVHTNNGHHVVDTLPDAVGVLAATEARDTVAASGLVRMLATLAATEGSDVAAVAGLVGRSGMLAATEGADTADFVGTVASADIIGTLAAIEADDVAAFVGNAVTLGTLAATETADTAAVAGLVGITATLAATETPDTFAATGLVASEGEIVGLLDAVESGDSAAFLGAVETVVVEGGGSRGSVDRPLRPFPVTGYGDGLLPEIQGEAHGVVGAVSDGAAVLRGFVAAAAGSCGAAGHSAAHLVVRAVAIGNRGQAGRAVAVLDGMATAAGGVVTAGKGCGMIGIIEATARGRHDDDAAAVAWLLAA